MKHVMSDGFAFHAKIGTNENMTAGHEQLRLSDWIVLSVPAALHPHRKSVSQGLASFEVLSLGALLWGFELLHMPTPPIELAYILSVLYGMKA
jgi:hypothetical protein